MSDTPETDFTERALGQAAHPILLHLCRRLERQRDYHREGVASLRRVIDELQECARLWSMAHTPMSTLEASDRLIRACRQWRKATDD